MITDILLLNTGCTRTPRGLVLSGGGPSLCELPAQLPVFIHAKHGVIMFDTGYSEHFLVETSRGAASLQRLLASPELAGAGNARAQLLGYGVNPDDVRLIVLSHFHADHIAGVRDFPKAEFLFKADAWLPMKEASLLKRVKLGFVPGLLPNDFTQRSRYLSSADLKRVTLDLPGFSMGYDLLGDGSLWGIDLPGHAPGHLGVAAVLNGKTYFFTADASYLYQGITDCRLPARALDLLLSDRRSYQDTLHRLHQLTTKPSDLVMIPYHCPESAKRFQSARSVTRE
jgi:glyoxylase-like metal-dependent hydrolase (beta-lactamase superfamily II)